MILLQFAVLLLTHIPHILLADVYPRRLAALLAFLVFLGVLLLAGAAVVSLLIMRHKEESE